MDDYNDNDDQNEGPVVVRRAAYEEGNRLYDWVEAQGQGAHIAFDTAEEKAAAFREAGDAISAGFWREVFDFLMWRESVAAHVPTIVLEDDEIWDYASGKIIKATAKKKGSMKGLQ